MAPKNRNGELVVAVSGKWVSWAHTVVAYTAFLGALATGLYLHYDKIVQNEYYVRTCRALVGLADKAPRVTPKNGFPPSLLPLVIDIQSAQYSSCSLQSPPVCTCHLKPGREIDMYD